MLKEKSTTKASDTERKLLLSSTSPLEERPEEAVEGSGKPTLPQQSQQGRRAGHGASGASCLARPTLLTPLICVVRKRSVRGFFKTKRCF